MRNTLLPRPQLPSRARSPSPEPTSTPTQSGPVPTIRLISATPSAAGSSQPNTSATFANTSLNSIANSSWASVPSNPSPLAPKPAADSSRKRLVPKRSKLSLLGGGKEKGKDLSDVVRRLGGTESAGRGGFEIYVDTTHDPDIGEIVMVKKKKSRAGLDGLRWGALGEVTNVPSNGKKDMTKENLLKVKGDEKEKWWSIGRGRKDSKEKAKEKEKEQEQQSKIHSKSPEPTKPAQPTADQRARFNSLDSGMILGSQPARPWTQRSVSSGQLLSVPQAVPEVGVAPLATAPRAEATTVGGLLAPPGAAPPPGANSIAIRAMRSVRSLARIGSWAQLKGAGDENGNVPPKSRAKESDREKEKDKEGDDAHKKKKKKKRDVKEKVKEGRAQGTVRNSTSSFEAGALSASPLPAVKSLGKKKQSILGLGLPSTMRLPTVRGGSTASSAYPPVSGSRLSVESALNLNTIMRGRAGSTVSTASSLRPMSTSSGVSSESSGASVRWDEECLQTVKERRLKERRESAESAVSKDKAGRESRRSSGEGRKRTSLASVFPETHATSAYPIVTVEEATADGHEAADNEEPLPMGLETPVRKARPRPVSEQLLGRSRPVGICEEGDGAISILSAATNDLAQLINRLDLEATPGTPDMTPLKATPSSKNQEAESPIKKSSRMEASSITSLRPYAQSRNKPAPTPSVALMPLVTPDLLGQQIAPWPTSPVKSPVLKSLADPKPAPSTFRLTHKRTLSPAPAAEPLPVFQPLRPAKARQPAVTSIIAPSASPFLDAPVEGKKGSPSSQTFGSRSSSTSLASTHSPVFKKTSGHSRKRSSLAPADSQAAKKDARTSMPIPPEAKRVLGLAGTMGGSEASGLIPADLDVSDPDSDIPDELQVILSGQSDKDSIRSVDDTLSYRRVSCEDAFGPPSPGCPPEVPLPRPVSPEALALPELPVFRAELIDDEDNHADIDEAGNSSSDEDTKKSFDFTGELKKLNESGASDRRSFVEQLENAFRTPARVDLRYDFGGPFKDGYLGVDVPPPVPKLPTLYTEVSASEERSSNNLKTEGYSGSQLVDMTVPSMMLVSGSDSDVKGFPVDLSESDDHHELKKTTSMRSRPSDGQLNTGFKFGGRPPAPPRIEEEKPLTLSDIIPPPSHKHSHSMSSFVEEDSSVLKSIYAKASGIPPSVAVPRPRLDSDSSSKRRFRDDSRLSYATSHRRHSSEMSFAGFESFAEVRRGFEFSVNRPAFYPPPAANTSRGRHVKQDSVFSIASVSSYGMLINPGSTDPFDFANSRLPERRFSDDMSMSMSMSTSVDDTFSFIHRQPRRRRVESDASSFYFDAPARGHRRHESAMSTTSMAGPPVSLYNRSFGGHRRSDSNTSGSSVAHTYAMYGANGGCAAWARHRTDMSIDSVQSDFSGMHLGRPGLGDKMLESGLEHGAPLTSISASPPESMEDMRVAATNRFSYDSIMDDDQRFTMEDSIFEKTGNRTSVSSESVFGEHDMEPANGGLLPTNHFRPLSVLSGASIHSVNKDDDTMITMFDGDHVRRRSVGSVYEGSPCVRAEKRKHSTFRGMLTGKRLEFETIDAVESPNKARIIEKPSIASTTSYKFGGERMIRAKRGLLERQSLEDNCLSADGEDFTTSLQPQPVFSRPGPASRSRSSTCTSSSGADTPPLSLSDGSSQSGGSQSSIDISRLNLMLSNVTHPMTGLHARSRARARGQGHRRRISQARMSRASVYETIEEEMSSYSSSPSPVSVKQSGTVSPVSVTAAGPEHAVYVVNPSISSIESVWDDDRGLIALRKYYALRDEAHETVTESKLVWPDTQFSVFATQAFDPPKHPAGMQALLAHSLQNYGPLPSELRPRRIRSRTHSRASPYPQPYPTSQPRAIKTSFSNSPEPSPEITRSVRKAPLQQVSINPNISASRSPVPPGPILDALKPMSPFSMEILNEHSAKNPFGLNMGLSNAPPVRPRVPSSTRRTALGWTKRSTGAGPKGSTSGKMSTGAKTTTTTPATATVDGKENTSVGMTMTPGESLRINRPRPRGRPTPAAAKRTIRV